MEETKMALWSDSDEDEGVYRPDDRTSSNGRKMQKMVQKNRRDSTSTSASTKVLLVVCALSLITNVTFMTIFLVGVGDDGDCLNGTYSNNGFLSSFTPNPTTVKTHALPLSTQPAAMEPQTTSTAHLNNLVDRVQGHAMAEQPQEQGIHEPPVSCPPTHVVQCSRTVVNDTAGAKYENVFADLSAAEMKAIYSFLVSKPELKIEKNANGKTSSFSGFELQVPDKTEALLFLDSYGPKPRREARVVLHHTDLDVPVVMEYVVGPLPNPTYYKPNPRRKQKSIPNKFYPSYGISQGYHAMYQALNADVVRIMRESYGASIRDCKDRCITFLPQKTSTAYADNVVIVFASYYATEFITISPLDLTFVTTETQPGSLQFQVSSVFYGGHHFSSVQQLVTAYRLRTVPHTRMTFPTPAPGETSNPGTINFRRPIFPSSPQAGPQQHEPEGKRYSVHGQHVNYLQWSFNLRMSTSSGPQVWDVRWAGERIAYEISLQDVGVIYAGANPNSFYAHLSDSAFGLGNKAVGLVPGVDCPDHATFLSQIVFSSHWKGGITLPQAHCIFEHNTGLPLRRHRSADGFNGRNYGGLVDRVLILRSIIVEYNYDYLFDVVFHQNGAMELKTYASGYIMSQHYYDAEDPFGFRVHEHAVGSIHHHLFNFKLDLDIQGSSNRYETLDFVVDERPWPWHKSGKEAFGQISFKHNLKETEQEAILRYNFSNPKYHVVYNNEQKNKFGNPRAYRIHSTGFSKQILPDSSPVLNSRRWSKYQIATTKRKEDEESSSSIYSMIDGENPVVDIDRYLEDNERIVDEDLVFWVTVGMHHIPHTEDIPNTPTVGTEATISLLPFNYFPECPSVGSRDSVRIESVNGKIIQKDYGVSLSHHCLPIIYDYARLFADSSNIF